MNWNNVEKYERILLILGVIGVVIALIWGWR